MGKWKIIIIIYLAISSLYGVYISVSYFEKLEAYPLVDYPLIWLVGIIFLALFGGIGVCAYLLWRSNHYTWVTIALQVLQLAGFCIAGYKYQFAAGTSLKWLYEDNKMELIFKPITAEFTFGMNLPSEFLYINLFTLLIIYFIARCFSSKYASAPLKG